MNFVTKFLVFFNFAFSHLVSYDSLDNFKDFLVLYTNNSAIEHDFKLAVSNKPIQSSIVFCIKPSLCEFESESKLVLFKNNTIYDYL
jgi:hypothetical protein